MISMAYVENFDVSIQGVYFGQMGIGRVASGDFSTIIGMIRHKLLTNLRQMPGYLV